MKKDIENIYYKGDKDNNKDLFLEAMYAIDDEIGNIKLSHGALLSYENIGRLNVDAKVCSSDSEIEGESLDILYYLVKNKNNKYSFFQVNKRLQNQMDLIKYDNKVYIRINNWKNNKHKIKIRKTKVYKILLMVAEVDITTNKLYNIVLSDYYKGDLKKVSFDVPDNDYINYNSMQKDFASLNSFLSNDIDFIFDICNYYKQYKYTIVSNINPVSLYTILNKRIAQEDEKKEYFNTFKDFLECSCNIYTIVNLYSGFIFRDEKILKFMDFQSLECYLEELNKRSTHTFAKTKGISLKYIKNVLKKLYFINDASEEEILDSYRLDSNEKIAILRDFLTHIQIHQTV